MNVGNAGMLKYIMVAAAIMLLLPSAIQMAREEDVLLGEESYYHVRIAQEIAAGDVPQYDELSYGGRLYQFSPYHLMLAPFLLGGARFAAIVVPLALGLFTLYCIYRIGRLLEIERGMVYGAMLLLIITPVFMNAFSTLNAASGFVALIAAASLLFLDRGRLPFVLALLLFSIAVFFGVGEVAMVILLALGYYLWKGDRRCFVVVLVTTTIAAIYYISMVAALGIPEIPPPELSGGIISELGQAGGISLFLLLLAGIGIITTWREKHRFWAAYAGIILLIAAQRFNKAGSLYLLFFLVLFAAKAYATILRMRWEVPLIRRATIAMVAVGLLFAAGLQVTNAQQHIRGEVQQALGHIRGLPGDTMLSHYRYGFIIEEVAQKRAVVDSNAWYAPNLRQRFADVNQTFMSRDLAQVRKNLAKYDVDYVLITPKMRQGLVWDRERQGLLFLLRNNETFKRAYQVDGVEVWEVIG